MNMTTWRRRLGRARGALLIGAVLTLAGCDSLVEYTERDVIDPGALGGADGAQALYAGALRSFGFTFAGNNGGTEGQALISGLMSDEFIHSGTFSTRIDYDSRATFLDNSTLLGVYRNMQTARLDADRAITAMVASGASETGDARIAAMYNRIAAIFMYGGMNYCNGLVFSGSSGGSPVYGTQMTVQQMLDSANYYFDKALAGAAGTDGVNHNIARLMKARILMLRGSSSYAAAAALAAQVPTTFRAIQEHSTVNGGTENGIYVFNTQNERWSIAHQEGGNGLGFRALDGAGAGTNPALADPRVPWARTENGNDVGFDNVTPQYDLLLYTTRDASSVWGSGREARLIEAEADLAAGNADWLTKLNNLRATVNGLAPLVDPGNAQARVDMLFRERAFWLFAQGVRLSDLRRLINQYSRSANNIFPTGAHHKGGNYGPDVNFPVPDQENQNPNYSAGIACIDRNA